MNQPVDNFMATLCADGDIKVSQMETSLLPSLSVESFFGIYTHGCHFMRRNY